MSDTDRNREAEREQAEAQIKVTDRRLFNSAGDLREELQQDGEEVPTAEPEVESTPPPTDERRDPPDPGFEHRPVEEPEGVDFTMLINAMAQPALLFLGEIPHPATGKNHVDLEQARIQIDMLELLRVKCRGNLSTDEDGLLDRMLYQLRLLYVAKTKQPEQPDS